MTSVDNSEVARSLGNAIEALITQRVVDYDTDRIVESIDFAELVEHLDYDIGDVAEHIDLGDLAAECDIEDYVSTAVNDHIGEHVTDWFDGNQDAVVELIADELELRRERQPTRWRRFTTWCKRRWTSLTSWTRRSK
jgi:hypothetical protein